MSKRIIKKIHKKIYAEFLIVLFQVYLVGHMPPGSDERQRGGNHHAHYAYTDHHNKRYLKLVRKFADIIVGQFFGHLHSDSFRVIYNDNGRQI